MPTNKAVCQKVTKSRNTEVEENIHKKANYYRTGSEESQNEPE